VVGTTYYLAAAVPYGGVNPFNPVTVPTFDPNDPPDTTFTFNSLAYLQKVRLMLTTSSSFPRITSMSPSQVSLGSDPITNLAFTISGVNLPCTSSAATCGTTVAVAQGTTNRTASCTGSNAGTQLSCYIDLTGMTTGNTRMTLTAGVNTLALPDSPMIGGFVVTP
jgi:hypothetical protein